MTDSIENETVEEEAKPSQARSCEQLLEEYRKSNEISRPEGMLLDFDIDTDSIQKITPPFSIDETNAKVIAVQHTTTYNPSPIQINGKTHLLGRMEIESSQLQSELDSKIGLFEESDSSHWHTNKQTPVFSGQDPFDWCVVQGEHIFGNVEVWPDPENPTQTHYRTVFRRYKEDFSEIVNEKNEIAEPFAVSPEKMKDVRLVDLENGKIGVFARPQKENFGGLGKIGYFEINNLDELEEALTKYNEEDDQTSLIEGICNDEEWAGVNQSILLDDGTLGILGHIARFRLSDPDNPESPKVKDYYGITFNFDPKTRQASNVKIIITAEDFEKVKPKKDDLGSIYFPGGLIKVDDHYELYGSVGDARGCVAKVDDPFKV
jgi:hypothetical protein